MGDGFLWENVEISPPRKARRVRLWVLTSHLTVDLDKAYNGLVEVQYYGTLSECFWLKHA